MDKTQCSSLTLRTWKQNEVSNRKGNTQTFGRR